MQLVPADVGHRQPRRRHEARDLARDDAQPLHSAVLVAAVEQQLQPQADAQKGAVLSDVVLQSVHVAEVPERLENSAWNVQVAARSE